MVRNCPRCNQSYTNPAIKFCLDDGAVLVVWEGSSEMVTGMPVAASAAAAAGYNPAYEATLVPTPGNPTVEEKNTGVDLNVRPDQLMPGTRLGEYIIDKQIGEGGMGVIYSATHPIIGKRVAIKLLNPAMAANPDVVARFIQEAKSVNQIRNRNIVDIFSFGNLPDGRHYFVMEFLDGESLAHRLRRGKMPWTEAVPIWLQMASAIEAAHKHGIVHRDLKPDNVFLSPAPEGAFVKVLDFGIAKLMGDSPMGMSKTSTGMPIGTPAYMAPEQAAGSKINHQTDLYAFGIILFETIAERPPFTSETVVQLLASHINEPPPPLPSLVEKVNLELVKLVDQLLAKDPAERPADMTVVREELTRLRDLAIQDQVPLFGDALPFEAKAPPRRTKAPASSSKGLVIGLGVVMLVGAVVGIAKFAGKKEEPKPPVVIAAPKPVAPPEVPRAPKPGRLTVSTNASASRVYLDKSATEKSDKPIAAGGGALRVPVPPDVDWMLRVEADGFKPYSMPLKIGDGEEMQLPVVLQPEGSKKPSGGHVAKVTPAVPVKPTEKPKGTDNGKFLDPFGN